MTKNDNIIEVKDLYKHFDTIKAVDGVNLTVERGKVVVVIGPSGSGKSTLLRCINHLETPTSGEIWIDGEKLTHDAKQINEIRAEIGMVFQLFNLFPHLTSLENVTRNNFSGLEFPKKLMSTLPIFLVVNSSVLQ